MRCCSRNPWAARRVREEDSYAYLDAPDEMFWRADTDAHMEITYGWFVRIAAPRSARVRIRQGLATKSMPGGLRAGRRQRRHGCAQPLYHSLAQKYEMCLPRALLFPPHPAQ